ncbi:hypothetical protein [Arthrobacter alpinus]|uniref:hypothetical protein n=1 Tax=Arthrobacter alpinus TaxID=656366 RepID=UPI000B18E02B|nr:hypothetical protein [Arthrobacter alpinus]
MLANNINNYCTFGIQVVDRRWFNADPSALTIPLVKWVLKPSWSVPETAYTKSR